MILSFTSKSGQPRFQVDEEGIWDPLWNIGTLQWKDVRTVFSKCDGAREFICVGVRDRDALRSRVGFLRRFANTAAQETGFGDLTTDATGAGIRVEEVVAFASARILAHR